MYRLLSRDIALMDPHTYKFLTEAELRYECFSLLHKGYLNDWEKARLKELIECPACQINWFEEIIEKKSQVLKENNIDRLGK